MTSCFLPLWRAAQRQKYLESKKGKWRKDVEWMLSENSSKVNGKHYFWFARRDILKINDFSIFSVVICGIIILENNSSNKKNHAIFEKITKLVGNISKNLV